MERLQDMQYILFCVQFRQKNRHRCFCSKTKLKPLFRLIGIGVEEAGKEWGGAGQTMASDGWIRVRERGISLTDLRSG